MVDEYVPWTSYIMLDGWWVHGVFILEFNAMLTAEAISRQSLAHLCVSWLSHTSAVTIFIPKPKTTFLICIRWEVKNCLKESLPDSGIEPTTSRSWIGYRTCCATLSGWFYVFFLQLSTSLFVNCVSFAGTETAPVMSRRIGAYQVIVMDMYGSIAWLEPKSTPIYLRSIM